MIKILLGIYLLFTFNCVFTPQEIHLIEESYRGPILILFGQEKGEPEEHLEKKRVYRIPVGGVLVTQFELIEGYSGPKLPKYFLESKDGSKSEILWGHEGAEISKDQLQIFNKTIGNSSGYTYVFYYVGVPSETSSKTLKEWREWKYQQIEILENKNLLEKPKSN